MGFSFIFTDERELRHRTVIMKIRFCDVGASCLELNFEGVTPTLCVTELPEVRITPSRMDLAKFVRASQLGLLNEMFKEELAELAATGSLSMQIVT